MLQLTSADWAGAAWLLRCEPQAIMAVAQVETGPFGAFLDDGRPVILFERHVFHRRTYGRYDTIEPDLSSETPGGYGKVSEQWSRLLRAAAHDRVAAYESASWGAFQIMGFNHERAGYATLDAFLDAMERGVDDHLRAFACFVHSDAAMERALRLRDWARFSRLYNGEDYRARRYDARLAEAYSAIAEAIA